MKIEIDIAKHLPATEELSASIADAIVDQLRSEILYQIKREFSYNQKIASEVELIVGKITKQNLGWEKT